MSINRDEPERGYQTILSNLPSHKPPTPWLDGKIKHHVEVIRNTQNEIIARSAMRTINDARLARNISIGESIGVRSMPRGRIVIN